MKNPLRKRLLPELKNQAGKYIVIALMIVLSVSVLTGYDISGGGMRDTFYESLELYNVENGNFETTAKLGNARIKSIQNSGNVKIYEDFYSEQQTSEGKTLRIYGERDSVNITYLISGRLPRQKGEIAIDRAFANNNSIVIGDTLVAGNRKWVVTGFTACPDYSSLFQSNTDSMFDAVNFTVAMVTDREFNDYKDTEKTWRYAWTYNDGDPENELMEKEKADMLMNIVREETSLETFVPRYLNQSIMFYINDNQGDGVMIKVLLYIVIAIMAFISGITTADTINKESAVIGTLRAMGYTKAELIMHYMSIPTVVTLTAGLIGNIIGFTYMTQLCNSLYTNSYSIIPPVTHFNGVAVARNTVLPIVIMFVINYVVLSKKLKISPLRFLRHDIDKKQNGKKLRLSRKIPFLARFSLRVITSNLPSYMLIFVGVVFANFLLIFGMGLPAIIEGYQDKITNSLIADHIYTLSVPLNAVDEDKKLESALFMLSFQNAVQTKTENAEKFSAYALECDTAMKDECTIYGVCDNSRYIDLNMKKGDVYVSTAMAGKMKLAIGDIVTLKEKYEEKYYSFRVSGIYNYDGAICMYMPIEDLNEYFDLGKGFFCGYFSENEITDIDDKYMGSEINLNSLTKVSRQLMVSMGGMMKVVNILAEIIFAAIVYLLSKMIIEKNSISISMAKVLGYSSREVDRLYVLPTTLATLLSLALSVPICDKLMAIVFDMYISNEMAGYFRYDLPRDILPKMFVYGVLVYLMVALLEFNKVKKIPMEEVLKNVE